MSAARHSAVRRGAAMGLAAAGVCLLAGPAAAKKLKVESQGQLSIEGRVFSDDEIDRTQDTGLGLSGRLEAQAKYKPFDARLRLFSRVDGLDETRNLVNIEELYLGFKMKPVRVRAGYQLLNWSATEAFHPADMLNARNYDSRLENPEKLGEPMVEVEVRFWEGNISAYYMPVRRAPILPRAESRLSPFPKLLDIPIGQPLFAGRDRKIGEGWLEHQWAVRIEQSLGDADLSLHVFQHVDRSQPTQVVDLATGDIRPLFHFVTQVGGTWQQVFGPVVGKLEVGHREFGYPDAPVAPSPDRPPPYRLIHREMLDHTQIAAGLEFGWGIGQGEGTVIVEGQVMIVYDEARLAEPDLGPFQKDVLVGYRHRFNDVAGTRLQGGVMVDVDDPTGEQMIVAQFERRLGDVWSLSANLRAILAEPQPDLEDRALAELRAVGMERWNNANELNLTLSRFF